MFFKAIFVRPSVPGGPAGRGPVPSLSSRGAWSGASLAKKNKKGSKQGKAKEKSCEIKFFKTIFVRPSVPGGPAGAVAGAIISLRINKVKRV